MAGHSKWANIQHRKKAQDVKRGKLFTRLIREITVAARMGGSEIGSNPRLRLAVDKALEANMPKDTIERAIKKGAGELDGVHYEEVRYEGYGPGGVAVMVDCMTDNRNRTVGEVRHAFSKCGGNLGTDGSVAYMFNEVGILSYLAGINEDALIEAALDAGAEDVITHAEGSIDVIIAPQDFVDVKEKIFAKGFKTDQAEVTMKPSTETAIEKEDAEKLFKLTDMLEELDDVQNVYSNADISDEVAEQLGS